TTKTCPNCVSAKEFLKGQDYQIIDAEERPDLAEKFGIMQAPTLVIVSDGIVQKFANASNIRRFVEQNHTSTVKA
ncbi:glutaredoxin family protein, partial [Enterocloster bolteae]